MRDAWIVTASVEVALTSVGGTLLGVILGLGGSCQVGHLNRAWRKAESALARFRDTVDSLGI